MKIFLRKQGTVVSGYGVGVDDGIVSSNTWINSEQSVAVNVVVTSDDVVYLTLAYALTSQAKIVWFPEFAGQEVKDLGISYIKNTVTGAEFVPEDVAVINNQWPDVTGSSVFKAQLTAVPACLISAPNYSTCRYFPSSDIPEGFILNGFLLSELPNPFWSWEASSDERPWFNDSMQIKAVTTIMSKTGSIQFDIHFYAGHPEITFSNATGEFAATTWSAGFFESSENIFSTLVLEPTDKTLFGGKIYTASTVFVGSDGAQRFYDFSFNSTEPQDSSWEAMLGHPLYNTFEIPLKSTGGGSGGAVNSVNNMTGDVILTAQNLTTSFGDENTTVDYAINTLKNDQAELGDQVSNIEAKIPGDASGLVSTEEFNALSANVAENLTALDTNIQQTQTEFGNLAEGVAQEFAAFSSMFESTQTDINNLSNAVNQTAELASSAHELAATADSNAQDANILATAHQQWIEETAPATYLALSGGDVTGHITFSGGWASTRALRFDPVGSGNVSSMVAFGCSQLHTLTMNLGGGNGLVHFGDYGGLSATKLTLGDNVNPWKLAYIEKLNNGADIAVPTTGGTIALAENIAESVTTKDLTVATEEGTINIGITAGVATIATNNGLDIVSQTKFDTAPTTDDTTAWADVNSTALVTKAQVVTAVSEAGGGGLPDQTDNAGKFLMTDGTTASWGGDNLVQNNATFPGSGLAVGTRSVAKVSRSTAYGTDSRAEGQSAVAFGPSAQAMSLQSVAVGSGAKSTATRAIQIGGGTNSDANTLKVGNANGNFELMDANGNVPRERLTQLVEVLPTADNGYTTVKNFGNGYVEITGYASIGTVGAGTGAEIQVDLPAGYTMADANYWVNIAPTSETTMFDLKAEAKARSTTHFMVAYKNEDDTTGLTAAGVFWEVRGMLATTEA